MSLFSCKSICIISAETVGDIRNSARTVTMYMTLRRREVPFASVDEHRNGERRECVVLSTDYFLAAEDLSFNEFAQESFLFVDDFRNATLRFRDGGEKRVGHLQRVESVEDLPWYFVEPDTGFCYAIGATVGLDVRA